MNLFKASRDDKIDLAARLGNISPTVSEPAKAKPGQPGATQPAPSLQIPNQSANSQLTSNPPVTISPEPVELLRLLRHPQSGQLIVEIAGQRFAKLADITDKEMGQYILKLAGHLLAFTTGMIVTEAGVKALPAPKVGETPQPLITPTPVSQLPDPLTGRPRSQPAPKAPAYVPQPAPELEAEFLNSLKAKPAVPEAQPPRRGLFGRSKPAQNEPLVPALNLAGQINDIAHKLLARSPLAATTKLEITSDFSGGIRINVNGHYYASPDEIPHPEVQELIKESIRQWEKSL